MKKNVIGHMTAPKESVSGRLRRWNILPKLLCLLVALALWLVIVATQSVNDRQPQDTGADNTPTASEAA
ncbi:MAG: hypothetical protein IJX62_09130 [Clostridia bacterium]|nr:hypothetical protein [Clostridia bacterium]